MNAERFAAILDAYGADARRWPPSERAAAQVFRSTGEGARLAARSADLDHLLDAHRVAAPSATLRARVLEATPSGRGAGWFGRWGQRLAWAPGAGLAAAGLAGVLFGAALSPGALDRRTDTLLSETEGFDVAVLSADAIGGPL